MKNQIHRAKFTLPSWWRIDAKFPLNYWHQLRQDCDFLHFRCLAMHDVYFLVRNQQVSPGRTQIVWLRRAFWRQHYEWRWCVNTTNRFRFSNRSNRCTTFSSRRQGKCILDSSWVYWCWPAIPFRRHRPRMPSAIVYIWFSSIKHSNRWWFFASVSDVHLISANCSALCQPSCDFACMTIPRVYTNTIWVRTPCRIWHNCAVSYWNAFVCAHEGSIYRQTIWSKSNIEMVFLLRDKKKTRKKMKTKYVSTIRGADAWKFADRLRNITCVRTNVTLQQPWPWKSFPAMWALAALVMGANMHRISWHRHVHFVTVRTPTSFLIQQWSVRLTVASQIRWGRIFFAAFRAIVHIVGATDAVHRLATRIILCIAVTFANRQQTVFRFLNGQCMLLEFGRLLWAQIDRVIGLVAKCTRFSFVENFVRIIVRWIVFGRRKRALSLIGEHFFWCHV